MEKLKPSVRQVKIEKEIWGIQMVDYVNDVDVNLFDLEPSKENADILLKRIEKFEDFYAYDRLVDEFKEFLDPAKLTELKEKGKTKFGADLTTHWFA